MTKPCILRDAFCLTLMYLLVSTPRYAAWIFVAFHTSKSEYMALALSSRVSDTCIVGSEEPGSVVALETPDIIISMLSSQKK